MKTAVFRCIVAPLLIAVRVFTGSIDAVVGASIDTSGLTFATNRFTVDTVTVGDRKITYRAYEGLVYVTNPIDTNYQSLNFYAPIEYFEGKSIGAYNAETAPIFFPNDVGGYMPGRPRGIRNAGQGVRAPMHSMALALSKGIVVASTGARGRSLQNTNRDYTGKAPACIIDLKAAVRYLRYNDKTMPGTAEKIISNGTSAGGALSALIGATGNSTDYESYLQAIGAANEPDNIFAASCYCPITNLENSDTAYEWLFNGLNTYRFMGSGVLSSTQIQISEQLKAMFPAYLNGLELKASDGSQLTLDANGEGTFKEYVRSFVIAAAQKALQSGKDLSGLPWITLQNRTVTEINFEKFVAYATRMKSPPAFDSLELKSPETSLFGTAIVNSQHFTEFSREKSSDHSLADPAVVKMMNPMAYIGAKRVTSAPHWRIRHGTIDRDTSLAIPVILATKLQNEGFHVDFAMPWDQGHGGDYDLEELFAWIESICR